MRVWSLKYGHLALITKVHALGLFNDKHVVHTNHKHTLIFLKIMEKEHKIYHSHEFSTTQ